MSQAIADVITGTPEVAEIARESGAKGLILSHVSPDSSRPGVREKAIAELARNCSSDIAFPAELSSMED